MTKETKPETKKELPVPKPTTWPKPESGTVFE